MKKTILFIAGIAGFVLYCQPKPEVIEVVREVEVIRENAPILVKPNIVYVPVVKEVIVEKPILVTPSKNWRQEMIDGVKFFEGFKPCVYVCSGGKRTIGYGETNKSIVALGAITEHRAASLLKDRLLEIEEQVKKDVKVPLNDAQLCALTSFTYNLGRTNLLRLINGEDRLNNGNYESVEKIMPLYRKAGGQIKEGLVKRRSFEVSLWNGNPQY